MGRYRVPFDRGELEFDLPDTLEVDVVEAPDIPGVKDLEGEIKKALLNPINSAPLKELARPGQKVCIVITDITRATPDRAMVRPILEELESAGIKREDITILVGVGLHRPSTEAEKEEKLGREILARYKVLDHDARDDSKLVDLGLTKNGVPIIFNEIAHRADLLIATGIVEPHQYAGFSGGRKTVAVGIAGEKMIAYTHGPEMLDHPGTRLARLEGNPFHQALMEIADAAGLKFIINAVKNARREVVEVAAGAHRETFLKLVDTAKKLYTVEVSGIYDAAICGIGYPKDTNLYQASRGASYLFFAPEPVVKDGGLIVIPAPCGEGAGEGEGEKRFFQALEGAKDMTSLLEEMRENGFPPGAQRAFIMAKVMEKIEVAVAQSKVPSLIKRTKMTPLNSMRDVGRYIKSKFGERAKVLIIPHSLQTLPVLNSDRNR